MNSVVAKALGRGPEHKSRLHNRRGELIPVRTLLAELPRVAADRIAKRASSEPWMAPSAVRRLSDLLSPEFSLLELGSGESTNWYAQRVGAVVSVEPNQEWLKIVRSRTKDRGNVQLVASTVADYLPAAPFDVVIVDHNDEPTMTRPAAVDAVKDTARIIVLDDSDRIEYRTVESALKGWTVERFMGFRPRPLRVTETTIFRR